MTNHVAENTVSSELPPMSTTTDIPLDNMPTETMEQTETTKETEPKIDDENEQEEEDEEENQFDDSTHGYLIYFDDHKDLNNLLLAAFMWFIQMFLYSLLWSEAMTLVKEDQVEVTIGYYDCADANGKPSADASFQCTADMDGGGSKWYHMVLPFVLLSVYTQPDIISCFAIIFSKKSCFKRVMALVVLAEGGFALFTGLLWCFQGIYKGSGYDAIVNSIGVLFIHDLDEQLFSAMEKMESSRLRRCFAKCCKRCTCCHNFCSLVCTFVFIVIVAACGQLVMVLAYTNTGGGDEMEVADTYDDGSSGVSGSYNPY